MLIDFATPGRLLGYSLFGEIWFWKLCFGDASVYNSTFLLQAEIPRQYKTVWFALI